MKKLFIISAILLGVLLLFLGVYNFAFKKETAPVQQNSQSASDASVNAQPVKATATEKNSEKITAISDGAVLGSYFDKKTEEIGYFDLGSGTVWRMDSFGKNKRQIPNTKITGLKNIAWTPDHNKALATIEKGGKSFFYEEDYQTQKEVLLKDGLDTAVWDNLGAKIFYKYYDGATKKRSLNIANPDGSGWQKIADITARNLSIAPIPLASLVSFWNSPNNTEESQLQIVGTTGGEAKIVLKGMFGADYLWAPNGSEALVSSLLNKNSNAITLGLVTIDGAYTELNIPTLVSKCVWSADNKTIYYALPGGIPDGAKMPNDYQENKFSTNDTFWKMDITTGKKDRIVETSDISGKYDSSNLFLSATEDALYFVNKIDQKLYRIQL